MSTTPMDQLSSEYEEFKRTEFAEGERVFYDGDMDPLKRWAQEQAAALSAPVETSRQAA
jgi:hypothetical protein